MKLPRYKYSELTPEHEVWEKVDVWGEEDSGWVNDECINDVVECILGYFGPDEEFGNLEIYGFQLHKDCPLEDEYGITGYEVSPVAVVIVNTLEWVKEHRPDWLE